MGKIRVGIFGMGRLGQACRELVTSRSDEFELVECWTRENAKTVVDFKNKVDVILVCVGSAQDAPQVTHKLAKHFCTVDSFDTHAKLGEYMSKIKKTQGTGLVSIVGTGWDPGLLSVVRLHLASLFDEVKTFWGPGVSLGHSNAIRTIDGVKDAIQFTIPVIKRNTHKRICHVVAPKHLRRRIAKEIKTMPHYFAPYKTKVKFKEFLQVQNHHAGQIFAGDDMSSAEFKISLTNNPHLTAQIMLSYAIASVNIKNRGLSGVFTVADIAPKYLFKTFKKELI